MEEDLFHKLEYQLKMELMEMFKIPTMLEYLNKKKYNYYW